MEMTLENKIEAILLFKNEPVSVSELSKWLSVSQEEVWQALENLRDFYKDRGIVLVSTKEEVALGTHPETSSLIEKLQKDEFSRSLGRAGLETLAIVLYKGPVSRREVDHIRGVNSSYILRALLVRGLVEKVEKEGRGASYAPTLELLRHLGITRQEDLPEYETALRQVSEFVATSEESDE